MKDGGYFHIRVRASGEQKPGLTDPTLAPLLLTAVANYHERQSWHTPLFLLMPDHAHALIAFPLEVRMSTVIGNWKRYTARTLGLKWQINYFDHRIRTNADYEKTWHYILRNPVVKNLCPHPESWPWIWCPSRREGSCTLPPLDAAAPTRA